MPHGIMPGEIVCDPVDQNIVYADCGKDTGLCVSSDMGENWRQINNNLPRNNESFFIYGIAINPYNNSNIYVNSCFCGFYVSDNRGENWRPLNEGLNINYSGGMTVIDPLDTNQIFLATLGYSVWSIHRSADGINCQNIPLEFSLSPNYPNPFNSSTTIRYTIPVSGPVTLDIYDILGRKVQTLLDISQPAGEYRAVWQADKVSSGMYFYRLQTGEKTVSRQMILLK
jgi:hypothetical protein